MHLKRRTFIQTGSLATASLMIPRFLKAFEQNRVASGGNKSLVIIQLSGGNDGLNTVIPIRNDVYYARRPKLAIASSSAIKLTEDAGIHPSLPGFADLYAEGSLAILNGVGYPNPDRSHFRSMDIWHSGSQSHEFTSTGWIGRYLNAQCKGCENPVGALELDDTLSMALKGDAVKGIACQDPSRLFNSTNEQYFRDLLKQPNSHQASADYLYKTLAESVSSADYLFEQSRLAASGLSYPATELGRNLKTVASLIFAGTATKVYYLSLGSFDTHVAQEGQQKRLFHQLNEAVSTFVKDLKQQNRFEDVMIMTFSEFGRRVAQNASGGTDHGTANNMFFIGGALKQKGLLNAVPDLTDLEDGDLKHSVDFKNVYATLLKKWLDADDMQILGSRYHYLNFL